MLSTKGIIDDAWKVPSHWIFEFYCNLSEKLEGQDVRIKSVFRNEKTPSMYIYYRNNRYCFKDFSSGYSGDGFNLVCKLYSYATHDALIKILNDYNSCVIKNEVSGNRVITPHSRYHLKSHDKRQWTKDDASFWMQFNIDSDTLGKYNIIPLTSYTLSKEIDNKESSVIITGTNVYGYTRIDGSIYKIYQPKNKERKFLKIADYIQGTDQLKFKQPNLIICSSLKDAMSLSKFGYNAEFVAPDSENSIISSGVIAMYKLKYKAICTLFDNDIAGVTSAQRYLSEYDIPGVILPLSKDLSDSVKDYSLTSTRDVLTPLLKEALKK